MNVLLIEDTGFVRKMITHILTRAHHTVVGEAENGQDGYSLYKLLKPDVVITDIAMPGWDGFETLQRLKSFDPHAKVIICSAIASRENVLRAVAMGAVDFIMKPFREEWIVDAVERLKPVRAYPR